MEKETIQFLKKCVSKKMTHDEIVKSISPVLVVVLKIYQKRGKDEALRLYPEWKEIINKF